MRRPLLVAALVLPALLSLGHPVRAEDGDRTRTLKDKNFKLTLPEEWTWEELPDSDKERGFLLLARRSIRPGVEASARVRVADSGGSTVDGLLTQVSEGKTKDLKESSVEATDLTWAGTSAKRLAINGKYDNGGIVYLEVYGAVVLGKFHQLDLRCTNGAEETLREELNSVAAGYELLQGAAKPAAGGEEGAKEGRPSKTFKNLDLVWELPPPGKLPPEKEGESPREYGWGWDSGAGGGNAELKRGGKGLLARCGLSADGKNPILMELFLHPEQPGATAAGIVTNDGNFKELLENNFSDSPAPKMDDAAEVGNFLGASRVYVGKSKGDPPRPLYIKVFFAVLKGAVYQLFVVAHEDAQKTYGASLKEAIAGLRW
jgi:hypothetical protein